MFLDEKKLLVEAGKGGDGVALFRREKYVPRGGPDGGDGGRGGDIIIKGKGGLNTFSHLAHVDRIKAEDGAGGGHRKSTGKSGEDTVIEVPLGTVIESVEDGKRELIEEIAQEGQNVLVAKGGNGGWGNWRFRSAVQQAPDRFNPGQPGDKKSLQLTLKLIADIGLVGLPNSGKSTFLAAVSAAKPRIADYPFTTLEPQLGVAHPIPAEPEVSLVIADIPGLIEGASQGKGLGITFLKHIERTKVLLHFISAELDQKEAAEAYYSIRKELEQWSQALAKKKEIIVLSKIDLINKDAQQTVQGQLERSLRKPVVLISSVSHQGVKELLTSLS